MGSKRSRYLEAFFKLLKAVLESTMWGLWSPHTSLHREALVCVWGLGWGKSGWGHGCVFCGPFLQKNIKNYILQLCI